MQFADKVLGLCANIPKGQVTTYKAIAHALHSKAYRAVGTALNKNPHGFIRNKTGLKIPCHRVVNSNGSIGGFAHGPQAKARLLRKEGIMIKSNKIDKKYLFTF